MKDRLGVSTSSERVDIRFFVDSLSRHVVSDYDKTDALQSLMQVFKSRKTER